MIFGNIKDVEEYGFLEENVLKCLEYAKNNELVDFEKGSHEIEGDNLGSASPVSGSSSDAEGNRGD